MIPIQIVASFQDNNKFQIFKFSTKPLLNKRQSKKKRERNDENNCLICFIRGQFLDSKAKTRGIAHNIYDSLRTLMLLIPSRKYQVAKTIMFVRNSNQSKLASAIFYQIFIFLSSDRPSKTMIFFCFILKALFVLEIFKFL